MNYFQEAADLPQWSSPITREYEVGVLESYADTDVAFVGASGCCCDIDID